MIEVSKLHTLTGHKDAIYTLDRGLTPNIFYSAGGDGHVVEWDLQQPENGHSIANMSASVYAIRLIEEAGILVVGQNFDGIHLIDVAKKESIGSVNCTTAAIFDIQFSKGHVFLGTGDGHLIVIELESRRIVKTIQLSEKSLRTLCIMENLGVIVAGFSDNSFRVVNLLDYNVEIEQAGHKNSIFTVQTSPDDKYLLSGSRDAHLKFWSVGERFELDESIVAHMYAINHIAFRPDGKYFATASMDKTIKLWDYAKRKLVKVVDKARHNGHLTSVNKLYWSDYNNYLISCSDDRSLGVWSIDFDK